MTIWAVTPSHANLLASAYLDLVDADADPQDIGMALLADSLQGVQSELGRKLPQHWQTVEAYQFSRAVDASDAVAIEKAAALVSDTARASAGWYATDTRRWLAELALAAKR